MDNIQVYDELVGDHTDRSFADNILNLRYLDIFKVSSSVLFEEIQLIILTIPTKILYKKYNFYLKS